METKENKTFNQDYTNDKRESNMSARYSVDEVASENKELVEDVSKLNMKDSEESKLSEQVNRN